MAVFGGPNNFGLFTNGDFRKGTNDNFLLRDNTDNQSTYRSSGGPDGGPYIELTGGGGTGVFSTDYLEVNTSDTYQMVMYAKTIQEGSVADPDNSNSNTNKLAGGHLGMACYDSSKNLIYNTNCGGLGDTTLSRPLSAGDTKFYLNNNFTSLPYPLLGGLSTETDGWITGTNMVRDDSISIKTRTTYRYILLFPPTHPEYGTAHEFTRIGGPGGTNLFYNSLVQTDQEDWEGTFCDSSDNPITFPDIGYATPAGTPVSRGSASSTYNYVLGNQHYPLTWTKFSSEPFTGESRNGTFPFRYATKFIRFLILKNYKKRHVTPQDHVYGLSKIFFGKVLDGKDYRNNLNF